MEWQTRWRIVILACLFGLVMLFALLGGICSVVGRTPRTTAAATFLLWLLTAALLIVGAGEPLCWVLHLNGSLAGGMLTMWQRHLLGLLMAAWPGVGPVCNGLFVMIALLQGDGLALPAGPTLCTWSDCGLGPDTGCRVALRVQKSCGCGIAAASRPGCSQLHY